MHKFYFILLCILFTTLFSVTTFAWGPYSHLAILNSALDEAPDSLIKSIIVENMDGCLNGLEYADVGVRYYYTDYKTYKLLHNYNIVAELLRIAKDDNDRAFAYCYKIHLGGDGISHNYVIPEVIRSTKLNDYIIHPIKELKIEGYYLNPVGRRLMENHAAYDGLMEEATGTDWSADAAWLNTVFGGDAFYTEGFSHEGTTFINKVEIFVYKFIAMFVSNKSIIPYFKLSVEESKLIMQGQTSSLDPSGANAILAAEAEANIWLYIITFVLGIVLYYIAWKFGIIGW